MKYEEKAGWSFVPQEEALFYRGGEEGRFFYELLEENLIKLNEDFLTKEKAQEIVQKLAAIPDMLEGNRQTLEWLRSL